MATNTQLTVSLEPHLRESLIPLSPLVPSDIALDLSAPSSGTEIRYSLLTSISRWARSELGSKTLRDHGLDPAAYSMISLLAGTRTSPSAKLLTSPPEPPEDMARRSRDDRKAITAIANAVLSVGGAAFAAWYATGQVNWDEHWRLLLAFLVAIIVAVAETTLYIIYATRKDKVPLERRIRRQLFPRTKARVGPEKLKADEDSGETQRRKDESPIVVDGEPIQNLRQRARGPAEDDS